MIKSITAKKIKDSRGNPTLEVFVNQINASVPSGASTGFSEARTIPVSEAIENIEKIIAPQLIGKDPVNQVKIDNLLIQMDGTPNKSRLGGNTLIGVSMAVARWASFARKTPLYKHIAEIYRQKTAIPRPLFNIINGGAHADNDLAIQEFMIAPNEKSYEQNLKKGIEIYKKLGSILKEQFTDLKTGDEGGYAPDISSTEKAIKYILETEKVDIVLDCAASQFYNPEKYLIEGQEMSIKELIDYYKNLIKKYPIIALEDPFAENDWKGFKAGFRELADTIIIIGDDLLTTNTLRIQQAAEETACNGAIIKLNQIGTVSEAAQAFKKAKEFNWKTVVSHRSGETMDDFIADFAVGLGADFIKSGAPGPEERMVKYNRLLEISKEYA